MKVKYINDLSVDFCRQLRCWNLPLLPLVMIVHQDQKRPMTIIQEWVGTFSQLLLVSILLIHLTYILISWKRNKNIDILRTEDQRYLNQIFWKCLFSRVFVLTVFVQNKCTRDHFSRETHKAMLSTFSKMLDTSKLKLKGMNLIHCILQCVHCVYNTCLPLFDRRCRYNLRKYVQPLLLKLIYSL